MMRDDTPYRERPPAEVQREQDCMRAIFAVAPPVDRVFEAFGGLGRTAEVLVQRFPDVRVDSWELDAECVRRYNALGMSRAWCNWGDATVAAQSWNPAESWGASLDFNRLTVMDLRGRRSGRWKVELMDILVSRGPLWFQLTDSAAPYIHLNWERYGLRSPSMVEYCRTLAREVRRRYPGYRRAAVAGHRSATYFLFVRRI